MGVARVGLQRPAAARPHLKPHKNPYPAHPARPDPDCQAADLVRQCKNPGCLTVFTSREAVVSVIENSRDVEIVKALASRIEALPADSREALVKLLLAE